MSAQQAQTVTLKTLFQETFSLLRAHLSPALKLSVIPFIAFFIINWATYVPVNSAIYTTHQLFQFWGTTEGFLESIRFILELFPSVMFSIVLIHLFLGRKEISFLKIPEIFKRYFLYSLIFILPLPYFKLLGAHIRDLSLLVPAPLWSSLFWGSLFFLSLLLFFYVLSQLVLLGLSIVISKAPHPLKASWNAVKGHRGKVFLFVFLLIMLGRLITLFLQGAIYIPGLFLESLGFEIFLSPSVATSLWEAVEFVFSALFLNAFSCALFKTLK